MKKIKIISLLFVILSLNLLSQNIDPTAMYFSIPQSSGTYTKQFSITDNEYKQSNLMLGYQWYNYPIILRSLHQNVSEGFFPSWGGYQLDTNNIGRTIYYMFQLVSWLPNDPYGVPHLISNSFCYKPTLSISSSFTPSSTDPEHNIWGFRTRNATNVVNNRLELKRDTTYTNPVLAKPWRCDNFYKSTDRDIGDYGEDLTLSNGKYYVVTINLRRKDFLDSNNKKDNMPVLSFSMPYYLNKSSTSNGTIVFNTKPYPSTDSIIPLKYTYSVGATNYSANRGYCLKTQNYLSNTVTITRNMLPNSLDTIGPDITISFGFIANRVFTDGNNPFFKTSIKDTFDITLIDSIGLNVTYYPNSSVLLNYIRIGNPKSDRLWKGEYDVQYHSNIQMHIDTIKSKGYKLFRFYGRDEIAESYELWDAMRYYNKLLGGMVVTEANSLDKRYLYRTEVYNTWYGAINPGSGGAPFFTKNKNEPGYADQSKDGWPVFDSINFARINYQYGYLKHPFTGVIDSLKGYETWFDSNSDPNRWYNARGPIFDSIKGFNAGYTKRGEDYYVDIVHPSLGGKGFQWITEYDSHKFFAYKDVNDMLYSGVPWWMNCFIFGQLNTGSRTLNINEPDWKKRFQWATIFSDVCRPMTGEESRWSMNRIILLGGKGILHDGHLQQNRGYFNNAGSWGTSGLTNGIGFNPATLGANPSDDVILHQDDLWTGVDFVKAIDTVTGITDMPIDTVGAFKGYYYAMNKAKTVQFLGCDSNRIYTGRKSNKLEIEKINALLSKPDIDSLLMRLRLVAVLSKGMRCWNSWDKARYATNPMYKYINFDTAQIIYLNPLDTSDKRTLPSNYVTTRPINRVKADGSPLYETWDSTMCDIALHRLDTDTAMTGTVYLAVQNRWTSPFVLWRDTVGGVASKRVRFLSTAEFDDSCDVGTRKDQFRTLFNQRFGCREVVLPFNICNTVNPDQHYLVRVTELKADTAYNASWSWWRKDRYNRYIDTIISGTV